MRARSNSWLALSLGLNVLLAAGLFFFAGDSFRKPPAAEPAQAASEPAPGKTHVVVRKQNFTWHEVESPDYLTYIANLRSIGCPEPTIRDIIVADVNQRFAHRRVAEVISAEHQWWRSEPDMDMIEAAAEQLRTLEAERRELLTRLLGPEWDQTTPLPPPVRTGVSLSGPVLGDLSAEAKQTVYDITARIQKQIEDYVDEQHRQGSEPDPLVLARFRQQTRDELGRILDREQMEEFLLRYSQTAQRLRDELRGFELTPAEFRSLFHARDPLEQQIDLNYSGDNPAHANVREKFEREREAAMRGILGPERYAQYRLNQDPIFRETRNMVETLGAPAQAVVPVYEINQATEAERQRIRLDANLSNEEKVEALSSIQADRLKSIEKILGPEVFQRYLEDNYLLPESR
jgi:hypothetical protein